MDDVINFISCFSILIIINIKDTNHMVLCICSVINRFHCQAIRK